MPPGEQDNQEEQQESPEPAESKEAPKPPPAQPNPKPPAKGDDKAEPVGNMPFDEAVNVEGSESVESDQEEEAPQPPGVQVQAQQKVIPKGPLAAVNKATGGAQTDTKGEASGEGEGSGDDAKGFNGGEKLPAGTTMPANAYNPMDFANLKVSTEISELFQYISRYKPHNIELETKFKPFIPEYIPAVGEVDAFLKVPRPDNQEEALGLTCLVFYLCFILYRMNQQLILLIPQSLKCNIFKQKKQNKLFKSKSVPWNKQNKTQNKFNNG